MVFGYATNESPDYMPLPISLAKSIMAIFIFNASTTPWLLSDAKTQVTIDYSGKPKIKTIVVSAQHSIDYPKREFNELITEIVADAVRVAKLNTDYELLINPSGSFHIGGPQADTGLTGRKIIADTYGSMARHGGGAFSGKDFSKLDRSGAYAARWVAKNLVAAGVADRLEVQVSYAIGVAKPISISVETFGTGKYSNKIILEVIGKFFDLSPKGITMALPFGEPFIRLIISDNDHFDKNFPWEQLNKVDIIKSYLETLKSNSILTKDPKYKSNGLWLLSWLGAKRSALPYIRSLFPKDFNNYFEPFIGGGSVLFELNPKTAFISDLNPNLINCWITVKDDYDNFKAKILIHLNNHSIEYYQSLPRYDMRQIGDDSTQQAADWFYLVVYAMLSVERISAKGIFGKQVDFKCKNPDNVIKRLDLVHKALNEINPIILNQDWQQTIATAQAGDFIYLDPPYDATDNSYGYRFDQNSTLELFNKLVELDKKGVKWALSNTDSPLVTTLFKDYNIYQFGVANRLNQAIATKKSRRVEYFITNYAND